MQCTVSCVLRLRLEGNPLFFLFFEKLLLAACVKQRPSKSVAHHSQLVAHEGAAGNNSTSSAQSTALRCGRERVPRHTFQPSFWF